MNANYLAEPGSYAFTGHRPMKLLGYAPSAHEQLTAFAEKVLLRLPERYCAIDWCYVGMAQGWDMAVANACVNLGIKFTACLPCPTQCEPWPTNAQRLHGWLCEQAAEVVTVSDSYTTTCMQDRNEYMVDRSQYLVALWNRSPGGTANCVRYAHRKNVRVINCWSRWLEEIR